jgi:hypothetical protein
MLGARGLAYLLNQGGIGSHLDQGVMYCLAHVEPPDVMQVSYRDRGRQRDGQVPPRLSLTCPDSVALPKPLRSLSRACAYLSDQPPFRA